MNSLSERIAWYRAKQYIERYKPYIIAVTGTYGCDLAMHAIALAIKSDRHVRQGYEAVDSEDIPESILGVEKHKEHMGMFRFLSGTAKKELLEYEPDTIIAHIPLFAPRFARQTFSHLLPRMLVVPHIGTARMDLFGSLDMIAHEYRIVASMMHRDGVIVLNADEEYAQGIQEVSSCPVITYGISKRADIAVKRAVRGEDGNGLFLELAIDGAAYELFAPHLFAKQHIYGLLAGLAASHGMGVPAHDAIRSLARLYAPNGVLQRQPGTRGATLLDDTAFICPERLDSSLKTLASLPCRGRKIAVLGDMEYLGSQSASAHAQVAVDAASAAQIIVFIGEHMRHGQNELQKSGATSDTHHFVSSNEAAPWLAEHIREHDLVYIAGGQSMNMQEVVKMLTHH